MAADRPCNALEALFVAANVRFVLAVRTPPRPLEQAWRALSEGLSAQVVGRLEVITIGDEDQVPRIALRESGASLVYDSVDFPKAAGLEGALREEVLRLAPKSGPLRLVLLGSEGDDCRGFMVNANHALCDGMALAGLLQAALQVEPSPRRDVSLASTPADWEELLQAALPGPPEGEEPFLPLPAVPISLQEVHRALTGSFGKDHATVTHVGDEVRIDCSASALKVALEASRASSATLTGVWVACLQLAVGEAYLRARPALLDCCVGVSVLVDLRPTLPVDACLPQAFGTVTLGSVIDREAVADVGRDRVLSLARAATADLRLRVGRGEAHLQALALCRGDFEGGAPAATLELSNQGIYETPEGATVLLAQRFDGYDGLSVLLHSERGSGCLRLAASVGDGLDRGSLQSVLERAAALFSFLELP